MNEIPRVTLSLFRSLADPRQLHLRFTNGIELPITVSRMSDHRCKFFMDDDTAHCENLYNLRTPSPSELTSSFTVVPLLLPPLLSSNNPHHPHNNNNSNHNTKTGSQSTLHDPSYSLHGQLQGL